MQNDKQMENQTNESEQIEQFTQDEFNELVKQYESNQEDSEMGTTFYELLQSISYN